ncbi:MAG: hypothetical protein K6G64_10295 [Eubacterium sp.]|nr:hypothetical protein [Eubacterium sp.]
MENSNRRKAQSIFCWTVKKYMGVSIAYWVLLFLSLPVLEVFGMLAITSRQRTTMKDYIKLFQQTDESVIAMALFILVAVVMSTIISFVTFSYMHNKRCVDFFGGLPVSRRTMFFSRYLAVVTMVETPVLVFGIIGSALTLSSEGFTEFIKIVFLLMLAIWGNVSFVAFISLCSGTVVDMVISYLALNISYPICVLICAYYPTIVLPGMERMQLSASTFTFFTPLAAPFTGAYGNCKLLHCIWWVVINVVTLVGCYFLCKKRKAETAQNSSTFSVLSNIIKFIMCFAAGFGIGWLLSLLGIDSKTPVISYAWFMVGLFIGVMVTNVLLHLIFNKGFTNYAKSLKLCASVYAAATIFLFCITSGGFGYDEYVPEKDEIEEVCVYEGTSGFYIGDKNILEKYSKNEEIIDAAIDLHKQIVKSKTKYKHHGVYLPAGYDVEFNSVYDTDVYESDDPSDYCDEHIMIKYRLKSGRIVTRYYEVEWPEKIKKRECLNNDFYVNRDLAVKIPDSYLTGNIGIGIYEDGGWDVESIEVSTKVQKEILEAIRKDYHKVGLVQGVKYHGASGEIEVTEDKTLYSVEIDYVDERNHDISVYWAVDYSYKNTMNVLRKYHLLNRDFGYINDWCSKEPNPQEVHVKSTKTVYIEVPKEWNAKNLQAVLMGKDAYSILWGLNDVRTKCTHVKDNIWYITLRETEEYPDVMFYEVKDDTVYTTGKIPMSKEDDKDMIVVGEQKYGADIRDTFPDLLYTYEWTNYKK